jgi:lipoprotein NlpI
MQDQLNCPRAAMTLLTLLAGLALWAWTAAAVGQEELESSPDESRRALARGEAKRALELTTAALQKNPHNRELRFIRASAYDSLRRHKEAIEDYDVLVRETPDSASVHHLRGRSRFKLGDVDGSIDDFEQAIELEPRLEMRLWERGISLYYAAKYPEGARQFEAYQRYDASDVENVVWRYLCQAQAEGTEKAREAILPLDREDPRVPMMTIYALYRGQATPEEVLAAVRQGSPHGDDLRHRLFYAHLYIGLYFEAEANAEQARQHLQLAHQHKISHYMWDVANVHVIERAWTAEETRGK